MPAESHPIPEISKTAVKMLDAQYQQTINELARQTVVALGLDASKGWNVDFKTGFVTLQAPEPSGK